MRAYTACTINSYLLSLPQLTSLATQAATAILIVDLVNLQNDRVYIISGLLDITLLQSAVKVTEQFYRTLITNE